MDGTLTVPVHDFEAIRRALDLPPGLPILEALAAMPPAQSEPLHAQLFDIERKLAEGARAWPGVDEVLHHLTDQGCALAVLTRNSTELAHITLEAAGLARFFPKRVVLGREDAEPKPSPEGVEKILGLLGVTAEATTMVGDYVFDVDAGRAAGCRTVLVDREGHGRWRSSTDRVVSDLRELL